MRDELRKSIARGAELARSAPRPATGAGAAPPSAAAAALELGSEVYDRVTRQLGRMISAAPATATTPTTYTVQLASGAYELRVAEQLERARPLAREVGDAGR